MADPIVWHETHADDVTSRYEAKKGSLEPDSR